MRNLLRNLVAGVGLALMAISATVFPAEALTNPPTFAPRNFLTQQTHYMRFVLNFNSCIVLAANTTCSLKVGALPYNAFLTALHTQIMTTFNPTTSATWALNTATGYTVSSGALTGSAAIAAGVNVFTGAATTATLSTNFTGAGELVTGNGATPTGQDGGFDLWATYTTGAAGSQGTQGQVVFIMEYIAPNDGACINYPMTGPTGAC
jgi:hypothetical protein